MSDCLEHSSFRSCRSYFQLMISKNNRVQLRSHHDTQTLQTKLHGGVLLLNLEVGYVARRCCRYV